jgi:hypothetical protein
MRTEGIDFYKKDRIKSDFEMVVQTYVEEQFSFGLNKGIGGIRGDYKVESEEHPLYGMEFVQIYLNGGMSSPSPDKNYIVYLWNQELKRLEPEFYFRMIKGRSIDIFNPKMVDKDGNVLNKKTKSEMSSDLKTTK